MKTYLSMIYLLKALLLINKVYNKQIKQMNNQKKTNNFKVCVI